MEAVEPPCHVQPPVSPLLKKRSELALLILPNWVEMVCRDCGKPIWFSLLSFWSGSWGEEEYEGRLCLNNAEM